jgi:hypothetical protein
MKNETTDKDVIVLAIPSENKSSVTGASPAGREYVKTKFPDGTAEVVGSGVNAILKELREQNLKFSFKAA